jgi:hypothetical protein
MAPPAAPTNGAPTNGTPTSPWVRQRAGIDEGAPDLDMTVELGSRHDGGLIKRGVHTDIDED